MSANDYKARPMPVMPYLRFIVANRRFVGFGFLVAFASSFGQTYFLGSFSPSIQLEFSLSHTEWGAVYLVGTLASAIALPSTGRLIDLVSLPRYTAAAVLLLLTGIAAMTLSAGVVTLALAIFLLRQGGQGLMSHISMTSMARYFEEGRGRAIALATLGFAAGEACLPRISLAITEAWSWRTSFATMGVFLAIVLLPALMWLLRGHGGRHEEHLRSLDGGDNQNSSGRRSWTRGEVLRDPRFYLLLPGLLAPAMIATALFFTHLSLAEAKGWSNEWIVGSYGVYALASTLVGLVCGTLIDKIGGIRLVPMMLLPMAVGLVVAGTLRQPWSVWPYFMFFGASVGISHTAVSAMWAELYGVGSIGAIKSLVTALAVLASAIGPVIVGLFMDAGVSIERVCLYFAGYVVFASVLLAVALGKRSGERLTP
ncbi:MAG: MFS transporter [Myxococcales bacterium]|nr:MFS transporter [Myxococcales bacterium]